MPLKLTHLAAGNIHSARPALILRPRDAVPEVPRAHLLRWLGAIDSVPSVQGLPVLDSLPGPNSLPMPVASALIARALLRRSGHDVRGCGAHDSDGRAAWIEFIDLATTGFAARCAFTMLADAEQPRPALAERTVDAVLNRDFGKAGSSASATAARLIANMGYHLDTPVGPGGYLSVGSGRRAVRLHRNIVDPEPRISTIVQQNKFLTSLLLRDHGIRVPRAAVVATLDDALDAARQIGYPLVLKPIDAARQRGVELDLRSADDLRAAFARSSQVSETLVLEKFVHGKTFRLLCAKGRLIDVTEYHRGAVTGDGRSSLRTLIEAINTSPLRGDGHRFCLPQVDPEVVDAPPRTPYKQMGLDLDAVPSVGQQVPLSYFGGGNHGGSVSNATDHVHPEYHALAQRIHDIFRIPHCGVDMIARDIAVAPNDAGYAICEVNSDPSMIAQKRLGTGSARARRLIRALVDSPEDRRVPLVAVISDQAGAASLVRRAMGPLDAPIAVALRAGYGIGARLCMRGDHATIDGVQRAMRDLSARGVLIDRPVEGAIVEGLGVACADAVVIAASNAIDLRALAIGSRITRRPLIFLGTPPPPEAIAFAGSRGFVVVDPDGAPIRDPAARGIREILRPGQDGGIVRHAFAGGSATPTADPIAIGDSFTDADPAVRLLHAALDPLPAQIAALD